MTPVDYLSKKYPRRGSVVATYSKTEVLQMLEEYWRVKNEELLNSLSDEQVILIDELKSIINGGNYES